MRAPLDVDAFYEYGFENRPMLAIRAPFAMDAEANALIGCALRAFGKIYVARAVRRQISSPIAKGEPIGVDVGPPFLSKTE